jgi:hypothetical protein
MFQISLDGQITQTKIVVLKKSYNSVVNYLFIWKKTFKTPKFSFKINDFEINIFMNFSNDIRQKMT